MKTMDYSIELRRRHNLSMGNRIYNCIYGIILIVIALLLPGMESGVFWSVSIILLGLLSLFYGLMGKELLPVFYSLKMHADMLVIKRSFEKTKTIKLNSVTYLKTIPGGLEITFNDYVRTYDLSWIPNDKFQTLTGKLKAFCVQNMITFE